MFSLRAATPADADRLARERGFSSMRLFSAAGQARARRFYEREGWEAVGEPRREAAIGLEYRPPL